MGANKINDILNDLGIDNSSSTELSSTEGISTISNEDIDAIIESNGFQVEDSEEEDYNNLNALANAESEEDEEEEIHIEPTTDAETVRTTVSESEINVEESPETFEIPINSPTLLIDESTTRFSGAEWFNEIQKQRIIIGGCGGIGSNLCFQLARMHPANITIYDDDTVSMVNMAGQLFNYSDVGKFKVDAMSNMILSYTTMNNINAIREKFTTNTEPGNIMMCGFDNMIARKTFYYKWKTYIENLPMEERVKCLFLDGRLSMDNLQVLCIRGDDEYNIKRYANEFLFQDYQAEETVCSMKQTTYLACMIGSIMVNLFTNFVAGTLNPIIPYDLPFYTEYDAQNMIFNTEC